MKAVVMNAVGGPEVLLYQDAADPVIRNPTAILVRLKAAGVNPLDTKLRSKGTYYPDKLPTILGCDGAGVVTAVGTAVQRFKVGDPVYFCNGGIGAAPGTYAQYAVVDEAFVAHKPVTLDFPAAAAVPLALITAWESLHERGKIRKGQKVALLKRDGKRIDDCGARPEARRDSVGDRAGGITRRCSRVRWSARAASTSTRSSRVGKT